MLFNSKILMISNGISLANPAQNSWRTIAGHLTEGKVVIRKVKIDFKKNMEALRRREKSS